jgi:heme-degrading monooxygenase HmoA
MSYVKRIEGKFKNDKKEEGVKMVVDFYNGMAGNIKGFKGFIMTGSFDDPQRVANISLWETKEDMDNYYAHDKEYSSLLETIKP